MLRNHFLQQWFNLSNPAAGGAQYDSPVLRRFTGVELGRESYLFVGFDSSGERSAAFYSLIFLAKLQLCTR